MNEDKQKVFITDVYARGNSVLSTARELIKQNGLANFQVASRVGEADIVLYLEHGYLGLADIPRLLECVREAPRAMHFLFSESDWPFPVLPGAYPSLSKSYQWAHTWAYLSGRNVTKNICYDDRVSLELLFSFLGRIATHPIRNKIKMLDTPYTPCVDVAEASKRFSNFSYDDTYSDLMARSKFILCPRGFGVSSVRMFEAMAFGRVPVVISDGWQPPPDIAWDEFCVRINERDIARIPGLLNYLQVDAAVMGQRARQVYEEHFSPGVFFDRLLTTLVKKYSHSAFSVATILHRAWRAAGWREIRTIFHQARTFPVKYISRS